MNIRHTFAVIPALIFWGVSLIFFVMGLSMDDHTGTLFYIACALALANTVVQLIGWDSHPDELGPLVYYSWLASYVLGIGTNMVSLLKILQLDVAFLEWMVAGALSFMIEVTPERLFVLAWRSVFPKQGRTFQPYQGGEDRRGGQRKNKQQNNQGQQHHGPTPEGMTRADYLRALRTQQGQQGEEYEEENLYVQQPRGQNSRLN